MAARAGGDRGSDVSLAARPMQCHRAGDRITQLQYGAGTITACDEVTVTVDFDDYGERTFATVQMQFGHANRTAPVRRVIRSRKKP